MEKYCTKLQSGPLLLIKKNCIDSDKTSSYNFLFFFCQTEGVGNHLDKQARVKHTLQMKLKVAR